MPTSTLLKHDIPPTFVSTPVAPFTHNSLTQKAFCGRRRMRLLSCRRLVWHEQRPFAGREATDLSHLKRAEHVGESKAPWMIQEEDLMGEKAATEKHLCQRCGKAWPEMYCPNCTILIQAEALDEKGGLLGGKKGQGPPTSEIAHVKRS